MSTATARGNEVARPITVALAVALSVVSVITLYLLFLLPGSDELPEGAVGITVAFSLLMLAGVWGLWKLRRWGAVLTFVLTALNLLASIPAFTDAPSGWLLAMAAIGIPISLAILVLLAVPQSRRAYQ